MHPKLKTLSYIKYNKYTYQSERFAKMKIKFSDLEKLYNHSKRLKIDFCVTPFDPYFVKKLSKFVKFFKVASGRFKLLSIVKRNKKN